MEIFFAWLTFGDSHKMSEIYPAVLALAAPLWHGPLFSSFVGKKVKMWEAAERIYHSDLLICSFAFTAVNCREIL